MKAFVCSAAVAILFLSAFPVEAQPLEKKSGWYLELLGNGGLYSINYERKLKPNLVFRVGAANWTSEDLFSDAETRIFAFPVTASYLVGPYKHKFEIGGGVLGGHREDFAGDGLFLALTGIAGYRYEADSGFLFRAGLTPFYGLTKGEQAYPDEGALASIGMSLGYRY